MQGIYETPQVEIISFSLSESIADNNDVIVSAPNAGIVP